MKLNIHTNNINEDQFDFNWPNGCSDGNFYNFGNRSVKKTSEGLFAIFGNWQSVTCTSKVHEGSVPHTSRVHVTNLDPNGHLKSYGHVWLNGHVWGKPTFLCVTYIMWYYLMILSDYCVPKYRVRLII